MRRRGTRDYRAHAVGFPRRPIRLNGDLMWWGPLRGSIEIEICPNSGSDGSNAFGLRETPWINTMR